MPLLSRRLHPLRLAWAGLPDRSVRLEHRLVGRLLNRRRRIFPRRRGDGRIFIAAQ